jgi:hypothetical protein
MDGKAGIYEIRASAKNASKWDFTFRADVVDLAVRTLFRV